MAAINPIENEISFISSTWGYEVKSDSATVRLLFSHNQDRLGKPVAFGNQNQRKLDATADGASG